MSRTINKNKSKTKHKLKKLISTNEIWYPMDERYRSDFYEILSTL